MVDPRQDLSVRPIGAGEITALNDGGWALLRSFLSASVALHLKERLGVARPTHRSGVVAVDQPSAHDEAFGAFLRAPSLAAAARHLIGAPAVRNVGDCVFIMPPEDASTPKAEAFHQDDPSAGQDHVTFQFALDHVELEQGPTRYLVGSHRVGGLPMQNVTLRTAYDSTPALATCVMSEPYRLSPGDATVHSGRAVHAGGANSGQRPRLSYRVAFRAR